VYIASAVPVGHHSSRLIIGQYGKSQKTNKQTNKKTYRSTEASWLWGKQINQGSTLVWRFRGGESFAINSDMTETLLLHVCLNRQVSKYNIICFTHRLQLYIALCLYFSMLLSSLVTKSMTVKLKYILQTNI